MEPRFTEEFAFRGTWRVYQARVLDELAIHLHNERLHVVAAPGSGKTVLGLEVLRRLDRPTLVLAPTLAIRTQWIDRLRSLFLPEGTAAPDWISTDLASPALLTVATYQALHMAWTGELAREEAAEEDADDVTDDVAVTHIPDLARRLREAGVATLVLDECHHLRTEWWRTLDRLVSELESPQIVALTATPPYDTTAAEWQRYTRLCGPIDTEIAVPELVRSRDLCPHQDYVFLTLPTDAEAQVISSFRAAVDTLVNGLLADVAFLDALASHPWLLDPTTHAEEMLADPSYASSMAVFLRGAGRPVPERLMWLLATDTRRLPPVSLQWAETLLQNFLFGDEYVAETHADLQRDIERRARHAGAIERKQVRLRSTRETKRLLTQSSSKLLGVTEVVRAEADSLGEQLRLVVLTDHIRAEELPSSPEDPRVPNRMGVAPLFEAIRRDLPPGMKLGTLSGSLTILPAESVPLLHQEAAACGLPAEALRCEPLKHDPGYVRVFVGGDGNHRVVSAMTRVFERGGVHVLVGTAALLGEGWDAPVVNALVLASYVGSYMLSNQMRGRAIRTLPTEPTKTANIWHIVCVEPGQPEPGDDWEMLTRRFRAFLGPSAREDTITTGVERLGLGKPPFARHTVRKLDDTTMRRAADRGALRAAWDRSLATGGSLVEEVEAPQAGLPRRFVWYNTLRVLIYQAGMIVGAFVSQLAGNAQTGDAATLLVTLAFAFIFGALVATPWLIKALWLWARHGSLERSMREVGLAVLRTMVDLGETTTDRQRLSVESLRSEEGIVTGWLTGGTYTEKTVFADALRELVDPVENQRYLLVRRTRVRVLPWEREDYHPVPEIFGRKRESAEQFRANWRKHVGRVGLVYTRNRKGRALLLRARSHSFASGFVRRSQRLSAWR